MVGLDGFHDFRGVANRWRVFDALLDGASADLLLLPAGFWCVGSERELPVVLRAVRRSAKAHGVAVVGGVDLAPAADRSQAKGGNRLVSRGRLPSFGLAATAGGDGWTWRQVSTTGADAASAPHHEDPVRLHDRVVPVGASSVLALTCGEMHNPWIRAGVGSVTAVAVVVSGHASLGQGLVPSLKAMWAAAGVPVFHVQHLVNPTGGAHRVNAHGVHVTACSADHLLRDQAEPWVAVVASTLEAPLYATSSVPLTRSR